MQRFSSGFVSVAAGLLWCAWLIAAPASAREQRLDPGKLERVSRRLAEAGDDDQPLYLRGEPQQALAALRKRAEADGWLGVYAAANMIWTQHPQESLQWHLDAYEASGRNRYVLLELALHRTRRGECADAVAAWETLKQADLYGGYFPALAAYCHLMLGDDARAIAEIKQADGGGGHGNRFGEVLRELWGPRRGLSEFADALAAYRHGDVGADLDKVLAAAMNLGVADRIQTEGLTHLIAAAAQREPAESRTLRELKCLEPMLAAEARIQDEEARAQRERDEVLDKAKPGTEAWRQAWEEAGNGLDGDARRGKRWRDALGKCRLVVDGGALPENSHFARLIVIALVQAHVATEAELSKTHGEELWVRASSEHGDFAALELLAALQSAAKEQDGLRRSDELGWRRYHAENFAASRVLGEVLSQPAGQTPKLGEVSERLLREALRDFPDQPILLGLAIDGGLLAGKEAKDAQRRRLLAMYRAPLPESFLHFGPDTSGIAVAWGEYARMVETAAASP